MIHPHTELRFISETIGYGVFVTKPIPQGTIVWTECRLDRLFTLDQVLELPKEQRAILDVYAFLKADGYFVLCWDHGRFMNHSCDPTIRELGNNELAVRDLQVGDQITCDYSILNWDKTMPCNCGSKNCRKAIKPDDLATYGPTWDAIVQSLAPSCANVEQPLYPYIQDKTAFEGMVHGILPIPSHQSFLCPEHVAMYAHIANASG